MISEKFSDRLKLRGGVYFTESLPKTKTGKLRREAITKLAADMFKAAIHTDPDIQSYLTDIPSQSMKLMEQNLINSERT